MFNTHAAYWAMKPTLMQILQLITYLASFISANFFRMSASLSQEALSPDVSVSMSKNFQREAVAP